MDEVKGYVNAQAMLEMLEQYQGCYFPHSVAVRIVNKLVQTDVGPVMHGQWRDNPNLFGYICSQCEKIMVPEFFNGEMNYCPNCGAKMEVKVEHYND